MIRVKKKQSLGSFEYWERYWIFFSSLNASVLADLSLGSLFSRRTQAEVLYRVTDFRPRVYHSIPFFDSKQRIKLTFKVALTDYMVPVAWHSQSFYVSFWKHWKRYAIVRFHEFLYFRFGLKYENADEIIGDRKDGKIYENSATSPLLSMSSIRRQFDNHHFEAMVVASPWYVRIIVTDLDGIHCYEHTNESRRVSPHKSYL